MKINNKFITFEGPECAGKTTQIEMLKEYFIQNGYQVIVTREPGGTSIGEKLRNIVKYHQGSKVTDKTEVLLFAASRAQLVAEIIKPALNNGNVVICDRFIDSTMAYQGYARGLDLDFIQQLNDFAIGDCVPSITFLLDLSFEESMKRLCLRHDLRKNEDRIEAESAQFHKKVRQAFLDIAINSPERIKIINAENSIDDIHSQIISILQ